MRKPLLKGRFRFILAGVVIALVGVRLFWIFPLWLPETSKDLKCVALEGGGDVNARLRAVMQPLFVYGSDKSEVEVSLRSDFGITEKKLNRTSVAKTPLEVTRGGKQMKIASWITVELLSFRSIRSLGGKNYVSAQFDFDEHGKLVDFMVWPTYGPEF